MCLKDGKVLKENDEVHMLGAIVSWKVKMKQLSMFKLAVFSSKQIRLAKLNTQYFVKINLH